MAKKNIGKITQIIGAVIDIQFDELPALYNAIGIELEED